MKKTDAEILDYYDEEVVKRIVEKYAFPRKRPLSFSSILKHIVCLPIPTWPCGNLAQAETLRCGRRSVLLDRRGAQCI